jgi:hypothetical protein
MKKKFLSYGSKKFIESRRRIKTEASKLNFFTDVKIHTEKTILQLSEYKNAIRNKEFLDTFNRERGGGYWMWKPLIIYEELMKLNEDDMLVYSDAGSTIPNKSYTIDKLNEYINIVKNSDKGILAFRNPHIESKWTKGDIFEHFNCLGNEDIYNTRQFTANRIIIKKNVHSMALFKIWWETAKNYSHFFDDSTSITKNFNNFTENRHDQSVFSLICKTIGVEEEFDWNSIPIKTTRIRK